MISKNDLFLILSEMSDNGIDTTKEFTRVATSRDIPFDVVKFINDNREMELNKFYSHIRKSYNDKKSKLYINIMKEIDDVNEVLTTLASLNLQILLFNKKITTSNSDKYMFLRHARAEEISKVLTLYFQNYDLTNCVKLLRLIKADIMAFEMISGRREIK